MRPNGQNQSQDPYLIGQQPRIPREIQLVSAFYQNRKNLYAEIVAVEEALLVCEKEDTRALENARDWLRGKLADSGPGFAKAMVRAAPLIREGFEQAFENLLQAVE